MDGEDTAAPAVGGACALVCHLGVVALLLLPVIAPLAVSPAAVGGTPSSLAFDKLLVVDVRLNITGAGAAMLVRPTTGEPAATGVVGPLCSRLDARLPRPFGSGAAKFERRPRSTPGDPMMLFEPAE